MGIADMLMDGALTNAACIDREKLRDELETLKAKVRRYFEMKALGHVNYFSKEDRKEFLELETDIQELVK